MSGRSSDRHVQDTHGRVTAIATIGIFGHLACRHVGILAWWRPVRNVGFVTKHIVTSMIANGEDE